jgi:hypothetical protein
MFQPTEVLDHMKLLRRHVALPDQHHPLATRIVRRVQHHHRMARKAALHQHVARL